MAHRRLNARHRLPRLVRGRGTRMTYKCSALLALRVVQGLLEARCAPTVRPSASSLMQIKGLSAALFSPGRVPFVEKAARSVRVLAGRVREVARASSSGVLPEITSQSTMAVD